MQGRVIFLLEERAMRVLLEGWLPRLFPGWIDGQHFQCVPHDGKSDLDRSIPLKLSSWRIPGDRFVIVRDNDNADCIDLKARLRSLCTQHGRPETLIRLVCQELESWYLGDLNRRRARHGAALGAGEKPLGELEGVRCRRASCGNQHGLARTLELTDRGSKASKPLPSSTRPGAALGV